MVSRVDRVPVAEWAAACAVRAACSLSVCADRRLAPTGESRHIRCMDWSDEGIVLSMRPHGESGLVASLLTRAHGRHAGFVPGGGSRRARPIWQPGNLVEVEWRARLSEQLGNYSGELREPHAARALDNAAELAGLSAACVLADAVLPEREC